MKTVLITGCSSGYGLETARYFHTQGWNVVATMRTPREDALPRSERLRVLALDVTKPERIAAALEASGPIDVLVNNAGIGMFGAFEATPMATVRDVFETNTFGVMAMTQAVLPQLRARGSGVVVNVTSSATLAPMPMVAVYTASKMAIEGFTASLALELEAFDVRVKLVEPGYGPTSASRATRDAGRSGGVDLDDRQHRCATGYARVVGVERLASDDPPSPFTNTAARGKLTSASVMHAPRKFSVQSYKRAHGQDVKRRSKIEK